MKTHNIKKVNDTSSKNNSPYCEYLRILTCLKLPAAWYRAAFKEITIIFYGATVAKMLILDASKNCHRIINSSSLLKIILVTF